MPNINDCRIVFMGTPEFAVGVLERMVQEGFNIVGVVTAPDKPAGRGMELSQSAVKKFAVQDGLNILQPVKLKDPEFLEQLRSLNADLQIVVAFRMLPEQVWNMPPMGTINLHASLLPKYRGAAPINWAIINGETETGITTFKLQHAIDTGDVLMQQRIAIRDDETAGELHDEMKLLGASLVVETIRKYCEGNLSPVPQSAILDEANIPNAPKIHTDTCRINWSTSAVRVYNLIRGLSPYPGAFTTLDGKILKVFSSIYETGKIAGSAGQHETDQKTFLRFAAEDGWVYLKEIQLEGKKRMKIEDFLRGYRIQ
ncbi:MAG: methionyl-tRNA formyltransferase [bacterium]